MCPPLVGLRLWESGGFGLLLAASLEFDGCDVPEGRVAPLAIVEHFDPVEDRGGELDAGLPFSGVEELGLHASPKGLDHGIVVCLSGQSRLG